MINGNTREPLEAGDREIDIVSPAAETGVGVKTGKDRIVYGHDAAPHSDRSKKGYSRDENGDLFIRAMIIIVKNGERFKKFFPAFRQTAQCCH